MTVEDRQGGDPVRKAAHDIRGHFPYHEYPHPTDHSHALAAATPALSEDRLRTALAETLHDAMCTTSHHDRSPARCSDWAKYPSIAAYVAPRLLVTLRSTTASRHTEGLAAADSRPAELDAAWPVELTEFLRRGGKVSLYPPFGDETFTGQSVIQVEFGRGGASRYARQSVEGDTPVAVLRALAARIAETPR